MKRKILYVHHLKNRGFIKDDYDILKKHYDVTDFYYKGLKSIPSLMRACRKHDIIYVWFMSIHTLFTTFNRNKKIYVAGGYDVANEPDINYGLARKWYTKKIVKRCMNKADRIISVSKFNTNEIKKNIGNYKSTLIYNSVDTDRFIPKGKKDKNIFITVGAIDKGTIIRKGIQKFINIAYSSSFKKLPYEFVIIGKCSDDIKEHLKELVKYNDKLTWTGFVTDEELLKWYQKAKGYCQLSEYESFGVAPIEAMSCKCIPIVSNNSALPEIVDGVGHIVDIKNEAEILGAIIKSSKESPNNKIRERVINNYSINDREKKLVELVDSL